MSETLTVDCVECRVHVAKSGKELLLLVYEVEEREQPVFDHLCIGYTGYPGERAIDRWRQLKGQEPPPRTPHEGFERRAELANPITLTVQVDKNDFERITAIKFAGDAEAEAAAAAQAAASLSDDREFLRETPEPKSSQFDFSRWRS